MGFKLKADQTATTNKLPVHTNRVQFKVEKGPHNNITGFVAVVDGEKKAFPVMGKVTVVLAYSKVTKWLCTKLSN